MFHCKATMNRIVHNLTLAAVLVHMVCGCCWHHAHGADHHAVDHHSAHAADGPCQDHDPAVCGGSEQGSAPRGAPCRGGTCDFVRTEPDGSCLPCLESPADAKASAADLTASSLACHGDTAAATPAGSPLRLHLAIQKLLL